MNRILFLCMGNICRSPAAHCVFQHLVDQAGLSQHYHIDSAGTLGFHEGSPPDSRMQAVLRKRGIPVIGHSRPLILKDFTDFDLILAMDKANLADARRMARDDAQRKKVRLFSEYYDREESLEVPDPYYGGDHGFEHVLDLVEQGCSGLLAQTRPDE